MSIHRYAAPAIRAELCRAARAADDAKKVGDRREKWGQVYGLAKALEVMVHSGDIEEPMPPGIEREDALPSRAVELAVQFLGPDSAVTLGLVSKVDTVPLDATPNTAVAIPRIPGNATVPCRCSYPASGRQDLEDHVAAMMHINDGSHHGEAT